MTTRLFLFVCMAMGIVGRADESWHAEKFLTISGAERITPSYDIPVITGLSPSLLGKLSHYDWGGVDGSVPYEFHGFVRDLNKDGKDECFLYNRGYSGSGGPCFMVFSEFHGHWRLIGQFQGIIYIFPTSKGWPQLVSVGRGGGGIWSKTYSKFVSGKYKDTLIEIFERGTITKKRVTEE